ncbi:Hypothetical protein, putative [Bodo saltans]|uniref:Uncharacterized protein n=1 Tax=Bodo saltans TaxID=75058 RepID=A0A0S4JRD3_BODSA|nr:Hypothetical protein, putative [Bodo saltans]|eukprot:CUG94062.1 Hypothetical protein, putative [Bodo saltans]
MASPHPVRVPIQVTPAAVDFAMVRSADGTYTPVVHHNATLTVSYDDPSFSVQTSLTSSPKLLPTPLPTHLLSFCIRSSSPDVVKVKGGWGQLLGPGETTVVRLALRKGAGKLFEDGVELRLWISYELIPTSDDDDEGKVLLGKWKEQRKMRLTGELLSSRSEASCASGSGGGALWKGRNFDLLNSSSIVVLCRMSTVRSEQTAEIDLLHDQVRLKKAQLKELQDACDLLVDEGSKVVSQIKEGPKRRRLSLSSSKHLHPLAPPLTPPQETLVHSNNESTLQKFSRIAGEVEWMEVVGMMLVMSSTALLVISL